MGHTRKTEEQPEQQLWEQLDKVRAGMLGIEGAGGGMALPALTRASATMKPVGLACT